LLSSNIVLSCTYIENRCYDINAYITTNNTNVFYGAVITNTNSDLNEFYNEFIKNSVQKCNAIILLPRVDERLDVISLENMNYKLITSYSLVSSTDDY